MVCLWVSQACTFIGGSCGPGSACGSCCWQQYLFLVVIVLFDPIVLDVRNVSPQVSARSEVRKVAGSIAYVCRAGEAPILYATGFDPCNQAIKAICVAGRCVQLLLLCGVVWWWWWWCCCCHCCCLFVVWCLVFGVWCAGRIVGGTRAGLLLWKRRSGGVRFLMSVERFFVGAYMAAVIC